MQAAVRTLRDGERSAGLVLAITRFFAGAFVSLLGEWPLGGARR